MLTLHQVQGSPTYDDFKFICKVFDTFWKDALYEFEWPVDEDSPKDKSYTHVTSCWDLWRDMPREEYPPPFYIYMDKKTFDKLGGKSRYAFFRLDSMVRVEIHKDGVDFHVLNSGGTKMIVDYLMLSLFQNPRENTP